MTTATAPKRGVTTGPGDLPLKGETAAGTQKSIDGKETIKSKPDPVVVERARTYSDILDKIEDLKDRANEAGTDLLEAFLKSKAARRVKVESRYGFRVFTTKTLTKLVKGKKQTDK